MLSKPQITVLGGGVIGLTTALALRLLGYNVHLVSARMVHIDGGLPDPMVPSFCAAASAYPHYLNIKNLLTVTADSQAVFAALERTGRAGVRTQRHYEIFEAPVELPRMFELRRGFMQFDSRTMPPLLPRRREAAELFGWYFDHFFVDMPIFMRQVFSWFKLCGGSSAVGHVTEKQLSLLPGEALVNCTGLGACELFGDQAPRKIIRGQLVAVRGAPPIEQLTGTLLSYNYTPSADLYRRFDGEAGYVHFFSRKDGWILGGSREPGDIDASGEWSGEKVQADLIMLEGKEIPAPIIELNREILSNLCGADPTRYSLHPLEGYRYYRAPEDPAGVCLAAEQRVGRPVIHNYGHAGSGVTVSWGSALEVGRLLRECGIVPKEPGGCGKVDDEALAPVKRELLSRFLGATAKDQGA